MDVEEIYKKKELRDHILDRPDSYAGSIETSVDTFFVKGVQKQITYIPALLKIFDEILVNAIDHSVRTKQVSNIKINTCIDGTIEVFNDGPGIPIVLHKEYNVYIPEMIFGMLLTSSNYNDKEERIVGGRNGLGSNITCIFSKTFKIETVNNGLHYTQEITENMTVISKPKIKKTTKKDYTKISYLPDFKRFKISSNKSPAYIGTMELIESRVYDTSCTTENVNLFYNDVKLSIKGFKKFLSLFDKEFITETIKGQTFDWEIAVSVHNSEAFRQVSFVNGINTYKGGKHVDYITNLITKSLISKFESKKKVDVKASYIKDRLMIVLKTNIVNPSFSNQSKDTLTTNYSNFGIKIDVPDSFVDKIYKNTSLVSEVMSFVNYKQNKELSKTGGNETRKSKISVKNLDDAISAGTSKSSKCTLILTEGLSAKTFALSGLAVVGREYYGAFALKGKSLNIREATQAQLLKNEEINNIKKIIGLQHGKKYTTIDGLRYGSIMLLTDADSVTYDTPVLLKNIETQEIITKPICEVYDDNWVIDSFSGKEYNQCRKYLVWSDKGWTSIKHVMRHKVSKKIHRVNTSKGCVDVTEDHSLLSHESKEIKVKDLIIKNSKLLHHQYIQEKVFDYKIEDDLAFAMGYFMADGCCSIDCKTSKVKSDGTPTVNNKWSISCTSEITLVVLKKIFEKYYTFTGLQFCIVKRLRKNHKSFSNKNYIYSLEAKVNCTQISALYRKMFYNSLGEKNVPVEILNSSIQTQKMFLEGFYKGDGNKSVKTRGFDIQHKTSILGMFQLLHNCGYSPCINANHKKLNVYNVIMSKKNCRPIHTIKKIIDVSDKYADTYVYDFETENHHFHAGTGSIIVHNSDGLHISALIMNMFHFWWPELLDIKGFIISMKTPVIKASLNTKVMEFYTISDYNKWKDITSTYKKYNIKYYKGLGTSTAKEARDVFKDMDKNIVKYISNDKRDTDKAMLLAFEKKKADDRKLWLSNYNIDNIIEFDKDKVTYSEFINKGLIHFSMSDIIRSIPSMVDGFKPSQRKVLYTMFKKNYKKEIKVAQLGASVAETTEYKHGEASLFSTIINLAQDYVGSNNINLLKPNGQFGCLSPDTKILLWDGTLKEAKYIRKDDILVGDDGLKRIVQKTISGIDEMYKVSLENGEHYTVSSEHILTFYIPSHKSIKYDKVKNNTYITLWDNNNYKFDKMTTTYDPEDIEYKRFVQDALMKRKSTDKCFDIPLRDYLSFPDSIKETLFGYKIKKPILWEKQDGFNIIDPKHIFEYVSQGFLKYIPKRFIISDIVTRTSIIKGLFSHYRSHLEITLNYIRIPKESTDIPNEIYIQLVFILESLGVSVKNNDEYMTIYTDNNKYEMFKLKLGEYIPHTLTFDKLKIEITSLGKGDFVGWEVDRNERFLLGNFVVTHNSRISNGKDAASPRYIYTELSDITRVIFKPEDENILNYIEDDGVMIEPEYFIPTLPIVLINGTLGIGTAYSTFIPNYNPKDIINNIERFISGKEMIEMTPWYNGFKGTIQDNIIYGLFERKNDTSITIKELPLTSIDDYIEFLEKCIQDNPSVGIKNFINKSSDKDVDILIIFDTKNSIEKIIKSQDGIFKTLKLYKNISTSNMHLFDENGKIKKYHNTNDIIKDFVKVKLNYNIKRKNFIMNDYKNNIKILSNKIRFLNEIISDKIVIYKKPKKEIIRILNSEKYDIIDADSCYGYLLNMNISSFTEETISSLETNLEKIKEKYNVISSKTEKDILVDDLLNVKKLI
jgi:DNA gyrase/topoisomerase IV subunit B